jgi:hypothetical protein
VDLRSKWVEKRVTALEKEENERNVVVALSVSVGEELAIIASARGSTRS